MNSQLLSRALRSRAARSALSLLLCACSSAVEPQVLSFEASAQVIPRCRIESAGDLEFGELDPGRARDGVAVTSIRVACTRGTAYRLMVDQGAAYDSARATRTMRRNTGERLPYALSAPGEYGVAAGWQRPVDLRLQATVKAIDYVNLPGGTYEDSVKVVIEY